MYRVYSRPSALIFEKELFYQKWFKVTPVKVGQANKSPFLKKIAPKNAPMHAISSISPRMIKTRGIFRTQSTTLTTHLRYLMNYFPKKISSQMFEWVLNTPLETFLLLFCCSFLINISSRSYHIFRAVYIQLFHSLPRETFTWNVIKTSILSKPLRFFWIIISESLNRTELPFIKKETFTGVNIQTCIEIFTLMFVKSQVLYYGQVSQHPKKEIFNFLKSFHCVLDLP